jgi:hypothetical protein
MQFKVPQFLEIEDKIFGPFTFKEFVYLAGGAGLCFIIYKLLGLFWGAIPILLIGGFSLLLTFYKPNDKPFLNMLISGLSYLTGDKLYIWERRKEKIINEELRIANNKNRGIPILRRGNILSGDKLRDLAWSLDVLDLKK